MVKDSVYPKQTPPLFTPGDTFSRKHRRVAAASVFACVWERRRRVKSSSSLPLPESDTSESVGKTDSPKRGVCPCAVFALGLGLLVSVGPHRDACRAFSHVTFAGGGKVVSLAPFVKIRHERVCTRVQTVLRTRKQGVCLLWACCCLVRTLGSHAVCVHNASGIKLTLLFREPATCSYMLSALTPSPRHVKIVTLRQCLTRALLKRFQRRWSR